MNHPSEQQIIGYCQQKLAADQLLMMSEHLQDCALCSERLTSVLKANKGDTWAGNFPTGKLPALDTDASSHLSYEQVVSLIDNALDTTELLTINSHLQACTRCQSEVQDLLQFKQLLARENPKTLQSLAPILTLTQWWKNIIWSVPPKILLYGMSIAAAIALCYLGVKQLVTTHPSAPSLASAEKKGVEPLLAIPTIKESVPTATPVVTSPIVAALPELSGDEKIVQQVLAKGVLPIPALIKKLRPGSANLMSADNHKTTFELLSPIGTVVEGTHPILRWDKLPDAQNYIVTIADDNLNIITRSLALTSTEWQVPMALERGKIYQWEVLAATSNEKTIVAPPPSAPEAKFQILAADTFSSLQQARKRYAKSPLELGILYARAGLLEDAEQSLRQAARTSATARKLLRTLKPKK